MPGMQSTYTNLTLEQFLALPDGETAWELIDGEAIAKVSPQFFHASLQRTLIVLLDAWSMGRGCMGAEWAVMLQRRGKDWVPVPDLTYVSFARLAPDWVPEGPCPIPADLVVEIISPDQTQKQFEDKARDYLGAGVGRVWVLDPEAKTLTVYRSGQISVYSDDRPIEDALLPDLYLNAKQIFEEANRRRSRSMDG